MSGSDTTCWTLIQDAAVGDAAARAEFAERYGAVIKSYLAARWRTWPALLENLEDAVQEVFIHCFRPGGTLERADPVRPGGFRPYLYGVVRVVALRMETANKRARRGQSDEPVDMGQVPLDETTLSRVFIRSWAKAMLRQAAHHQRQRAELLGEEAQRRVELLRLRFQESLPIREIAQRWQTDADRLHREYAKARKEFKESLKEVVAYHHPGSPAEVERECEELRAYIQ